MEILGIEPKIITCKVTVLPFKLYPPFFLLKLKLYIYIILLNILSNIIKMYIIIFNLVSKPSSLIQLLVYESSLVSISNISLYTAGFSSTIVASISLLLD